jgi:sporulation protein YtfJ
VKEHPINSLLNVSLDNITRMVDVSKIVGQPISLGENRIIIPISKVTFGFGAGGSEFDVSKNKKKVFDVEFGEELFPFGGGSGGGISISPSAFILIDNDNIKIVRYQKDNTIYDKLFETAIEFINKNNKN